MPADPLAPLLDLVGVAEAVEAARDAVARLREHPRAYRDPGSLRAEVALRGAVASSTLEGARYGLDDVRAGTVTDPVVQGALRVAQELPALGATWSRAPAQALARLHALAARGLVADDLLGRPVGDAATTARLHALSGLVTGGSDVPVVLLAAVVHGEILTLDAFAPSSGVVARAAAHLTLVAGGLDPDALVLVDVGHERRQPEYVGAAGAYATGRPDGVRSWLRHCADAVRTGADLSFDLCQEDAAQTTG